MQRRSTLKNISSSRLTIYRGKASDVISGRQPDGSFCSQDGEGLFVMEHNYDFFQYRPMSTNNDITTLNTNSIVVGGYAGTMPLSTGDKCAGLFIRDNYLDVYWVTNNGFINHRTLNNPKDFLNSSGYSSITSIDLGLDLYNIGKGLHISDDGKYLFLKTNLVNLNKYELVTPWDLSTINLNPVQTNNDTNRDWSFSKDGKNIISLAKGAENYISQYKLASAWDLDTLHFEYSLNLEGVVSSYALADCSYSSDGYKFFIGDYSNRLYHEFELTQPYRLGRLIIDTEPNTFIGGVSSEVSDADSLASKLNVDSFNIQNFKKVGDNIECTIIADYSPDLITHGFSNSSMTYFRDIDGRCLTLSVRFFRNCSALEDVLLPSVTVVPDGNNGNDFCFIGCTSMHTAIFGTNTPSGGLVTLGDYGFHNNTALVNLDTSKLEAIGASGLRGVGLTTIDLTSITSLGGSAVAYNVDLTSIIGLQNLISAGTGALSQNDLISSIDINPDFKEFPALFLEGNDSLTDILSIEHVEILNSRSVRYCPLKSTTTFNSVTRMVGGVNTGTYLFQTNTITELIAPNLEEIENSFCFQGTNYVLFDFKKLKILTNADAFVWYGISYNNSLVLNVHEDLLTSNSGGVNPSVQYFKSTKGGTVNFYDDNGDYVSTL